MTDKTTNNGIAELEDETVGQDEYGIVGIAEFTDEDFLFNYDEEQAKREKAHLESIEIELGISF